MSYKKTFAVLLALLVAASFNGFGPPRSAQAALNGWQQGMSISPRWNTDFSSGSFQDSLRNLAAARANYVTLILPYYQSNVYSTDIGPGWNTPPDQDLVNGINFAHSLGLRVNLKIHAESNDGQWRANINPGDRNTWYANYNGILQHVGQIAAQTGAEEMTIGTELINMASRSVNGDNTQRWRTMIGSLRGIYSGRLTYSANWGSPGTWADEAANIAFWDALDYIGISAYYNLPAGDNSAASIAEQWRNWDNSILGPLQARWGKQILFTEVGYRSLSGTRYEPWNSWNGGSYDGAEQANLYEGLFSYWQNRPYFAGVQLWNWSSDPNAGWPGNIDYTPQHKPAQDVMTQWFSGGGTPPPPPPGNPSFGGSVSGSPSNPSVGQAIAVQGSATANGQPGSNIIVDLEVYDSSNQKIFQQFWSGQNFVSGQTRTYQANWTPASAGNYTLALGIFGNNWSPNYLWQTSGISVGVSPPPPSGGAIEVWWPANGSHVTGIQPFKAMLANWDTANYDMFWQVGGDRLNGMYTSTADYPHKEAMVDLSGWTWKGNGPYDLNFVAKDKSGNTLGSQGVQIYIP